MLNRPGPLKRLELIDRDRRADIFAGLISACGLKQPEAAEVLGLKAQTISLKSSGARPVTDLELQILRDTWTAIQSGTADHLPDGAQRVARALRWIAETPGHDERDYDVDDT